MGQAAAVIHHVQPVALAERPDIAVLDIDLPGRVTVRESDVKLSGSDVVCARTPLGVIGLSICYDLRFPELYRRLTFSGAQILTIPSAFTFPTGEAHWEVPAKEHRTESVVESALTIRAVAFREPYWQPGHRSPSSGRCRHQA